MILWSIGDVKYYFQLEILVMRCLVYDQTNKGKSRRWLFLLITGANKMQTVLIRLLIIGKTFIQNHNFLNNQQQKFTTNCTCENRNSFQIMMRWITFYKINIGSGQKRENVIFPAILRENLPRVVFPNKAGRLHWRNSLWKQNKRLKHEVSVSYGDTFIKNPSKIQFLTPREVTPRVIVLFLSDH